MPRPILIIQERLSIKIILFPVDRPGDLKRCDWRHFFSFLLNNIFPKNGQYFHGKKEVEFFFAAARLASTLATRCTGNRFCFMDSQMSASII